MPSSVFSLNASGGSPDRAKQPQNDLYQGNTRGTTLFLCNPAPLLLAPKQSRKHPNTVYSTDVATFATVTVGLDSQRAGAVSTINTWAVEDVGAEEADFPFGFSDRERVHPAPLVRDYQSNTKHRRSVQ